MTRGILMVGLSFALASVGCGAGESEDSTLATRLYRASVNVVQKAQNNTKTTCEKIEMPVGPPPADGSAPKMEEIEVCTPVAEDVVCHEDFIKCMDNGSLPFDPPNAGSAAPDEKCMKVLTACLEKFHKPVKPQTCEEIAKQILKDTGDKQLFDIHLEMCEWEKLAASCDGNLLPDLTCEPHPTAPPVPLPDEPHAN
jgi:hypothetical protein